MRQNEMRFLALGAAIAVMAGFLASVAPAQDPARRSTRHLEADGGKSVALDLAAMEREYARIREVFKTKVDRSISEAKSILEAPLESGLPACRFPSKRSQPLSSILPPEFRGRSLLILNAGDPARAKALAERHPEAAVLVSDAPRLSDAAQLSKTLGRPVDVAASELLRSVGVACTPCLVTIDAKGDRLDLVEGE